MAFLDNSGDIILDAVLTDEGRKRLAKGSFTITKFAFGDDEINYGLYDPSHAGGSAYYDLEILQTPVFEAFTNNASSMHSKVLSITNPNLLYLPVIKLNEIAPLRAARAASGFGKDTFILIADKNTNDTLYAAGMDVALDSGIIAGMADVSTATRQAITVDQGLDTTSIGFATPIDFTLRETSYTLELDGRLFGLLAATGDTFLDVSATDDDGIDTYIFSSADGSNLVIDNTDTSTAGGSDGETIAGPRGTRLEFSLKAKQDLADSNYYFDEFGSTDAGSVTIGGKSITGVRYIDTYINIFGVTTGYNLQIPIRIVKKT